MREDFPTLLRSFRERAGRSRNNLAIEVGVNPSYLTRIEHGDREPPRQHIVEALARALRLSIQERNRLLVAAGFAPLSVMQLGSWDDALQAVADVLNDAHLSPEERDQFRSVVQMVSARWRGVGETSAHVANDGELLDARRTIATLRIEVERLERVAAKPAAPPAAVAFLAGAIS